LQDAREEPLKTKEPLCLKDDKPEPSPQGDLPELELETDVRSEKLNEAKDAVKEPKNTENVSKKKPGRGVPQDKSEAAKWYRRAAEQGNADAQRALGFCYDNGEGVTQDKVAAVKWYRKAADQGDAVAQCNLGVCYESGEGIPQDKAEAAKWYLKAADQGDTQAQNNLKEIHGQPKSSTDKPIPAGPKKRATFKEALPGCLMFFVLIAGICFGIKSCFFPGHKDASTSAVPIGNKDTAPTQVTAPLKYLPVSREEVRSIFKQTDVLSSEHTAEGTTLDSYSCKCNTLELETYNGRLVRASLKYDVLTLKTDVATMMSFMVGTWAFSQHIAGINLKDPDEAQKLGLNHIYSDGPDELTHNGVTLRRYTKGGVVIFEALPK
jgi:hypothetical protein